MTRLQSELQRLFLPLAQTHGGEPTPATGSGVVRVLVLELAAPPSWESLSSVWHGVQAGLGLPPPAIAVSGSDALQLWFSLAQPVTVARGHAFLTLVQQRFLPDVAAGRVRLWPATAAPTPRQALHPPLVPALLEDTGHWSAFVAPGLAPVFDDTPWLDSAPNEEGQAALLGGLQPAKPDAFDAAMDQLVPSASSAPALQAHAAGAGQPAPQAGPAVGTPAGDEAVHFLRQVMHDDTVPMALRIDAAKALLQHAPR